MSFDYAAANDKDLELYRAWKANPSKENMSALVKSLMPLIHTELSRARGTLADSVLKTDAMKWAIEAINRYDESKGVKLSTHVVNWLQKVRRTNYTYQNAVRLPETDQLMFNKFDTARTNLSVEFNRDPTEAEMAKELGWTVKKVKDFQGKLYDDLYESSSLGDTSVHGFSSEDALVDMVRNSLTYEERIIFDNKMADKHLQLNNTQLAAKLGVNQNRLQYLTRSVVDKAKKLKSSVGSWD